MIIRKLYLDRLLAFVRQPIIKVITGMRRAGKSTLLTMLAEQLLQDGVRQEQVIRMNFESMMFDDVHDYRQLYRRVQEEIGTQKQVYLLLDEVQQVEHWEKAINSLFVEGGGTVNWSFLAGGYVDKVHAFIAPLLMGGASAKTPVGGTGFDSPQTALHLADVTVEQIGADILVTGYPCADAE